MPCLALDATARPRPFRRYTCSAAIKYYALIAGKEPGVYKTWEEVLERTTGYSNIEHKWVEA